jgi:hypothetical protein
VTLRHLAPVALAAAALAACGGGGDSTGPKTPQTTTFAFTDPTGDIVQTAGTDTAAAADVVQITGSITQDTLAVSVHLAQPPRRLVANDSGAFYGFLELDVDEQTTTGISTFAEDAGLSSNNIGEDFFIFFAALRDLPFIVNAQTGDFLQAGEMNYGGDSVVIRIPLTQLSQDDAKLRMVGFVTNAERLADSTVGRASDVFPNNGYFEIHLGASPHAVASMVSVGSPLAPRASRLAATVRRLFRRGS